MRLLDLFCGAGGCSVGYERAGFEVVGVDMHPQKHYRGGTFVQADALEFAADHGHEFDAIHASPPCQAYSSLRYMVKAATRRAYVDLIPATRKALQATGKLYVIENVPGAPLGGSGTHVVTLCGSMFGLVTPDGSAEIRRHRKFELNWHPGPVPVCQHGISAARYVITVAGHDFHSPAVRHAQRRSVARTESPTNCGAFTTDEARAAMGIDWMPRGSLSQAIPPAYTQWLGQRLMAVLATAQLMHRFRKTGGKK